MTYRLRLVCHLVQDMLLQQQVRSATPPLSATAQLSQLSHLTQSMHQERSLQASQQLAAAQQTVGLSSQTPGVGSQLLGGAGNQQALLLGGGAQQVNGLGSGSNIQQGKASGSSPQQALGAVKVEPQSLGHSLQQQQQQILMPKMEVKSEMDLDQKVSSFDRFFLLDARMP